MVLTIRRGAHRMLPWMALCTLGCGRGGGAPPETPPPAPADEMVVDTATVTLPLRFPSQLYVEHDAAVAARSAGVIDTILVDLGSRVEAGQLLARIESVDQELALARADAALDASERAVKRARSLGRVQGITPADSEQAELQHREAELTQRQARRALELTRVVAPFAGVIAARYVGPSRLVAEGDTLFRVTETGPLQARIRVPERSAGSLRAGASAEVEGLGGRRETAKVIRVAPAIDGASGTREAVVQLERGGSLLPGAAVTVQLGRERRVVLAVPRAAVTGDGFVLVADGPRTALRAVILGSDLGDGRVEILSGLRAGERVARPNR